ncbi:MAG: hypothetical protein CM1200mP2_30330 [Planctomycetaceae bacterium]|nr:MAG: hypothetical protein CM1200mP2_30330 [Planctomycetaceae bacterium]
MRASLAWASVARMISSEIPFDFQVELNSGDAELAAGDLEVHVAEVILVTDDVGQQFEPSVRLGDDTDRDAGDRLQDRNARGHQAQRRAADTGHRARTIRLGDVGDRPDRVGKCLGVGQDRDHGPFGQGPVPDFSTARTSDHPALTHRVGWEVVVEHEPLLELLDRPVDPLGVAGRTECDRADRLGLTRVKTADPWTRGSRSTMHEMSRRSVMLRPSSRVLSLRIRSRTTCCSRSWKASEKSPRVEPSAVSSESSGKCFFEQLGLQ